MKKLAVGLVMGVVFTLVLLFWGSTVYCAIPHLINYQGMLTDDEGVPLTGPHNLTFRIYDDTTDGNLEWSETQSGVQVEQGLFNMILGQVTQLNLPFEEQYWLEVQVDSEIMPRIKFTSVGYAYRALVADSAVVAGSSSGGGSGGWVDDGSVVRLETGTDSIGIGTTDPTEKLDIDGTARLRGIADEPGGEPRSVVVIDANGVLLRELSPSSRKYKQNIRELNIDMEEVLRLQAVRFEWKKNGREDTGLIAEDVEKAVPDLVRFGKDGSPEGVRYDKLALYLLEALKDQQERISALEQEIAELKR